MADPAFLTEDEARQLTGRVLSLSRADEARVNLSSSTERNTRFAGNQITTSGETRNATVSVSSAFGRRMGTATTNRFDDEALRRVVENSEQLARLAPENPEYMPQLGPQTYPVMPQPWFESTLELDAELRTQAVLEVTREAQARGLIATGFLPVRAGSEAVATSAGLFAYNRSTQAAFSTTVRTPDGTGSGWAGTAVHDWTQADAAAMARRAVEKAERSRDPQPIEPGRWTVVLEPQAVGNILGHIFGQVGARAADEGRSFFARTGGGNRIGEPLLDSRVTLISDPGDPRLFTSPFNQEGLPNGRMVWFERGRLENLTYDRFWAQRQGRSPTGFAGGSFLLDGGNATLEEMIASTPRGLLVTRFWYMRSVDSRTILFTGLTRDGTFLIENGRISRPVQNLRWNESPINVLSNIEMIGRPERIMPSESGGVSQAVVVPPLKVRNFNFTSVSDAV
jgi:predicted Zn-dependent protease